MLGGGPIGSGYTSPQPTPVSGERSFDTAVQESVAGSPLDTRKRKRKRRMANFTGYRSTNSWTKTPEINEIKTPQEPTLSELA